ncbi:MAG: fused DSP-PTPase phosphatase/NAD kinase-like protein [Bdellovibrionales bacterium]
MTALRLLVLILFASFTVKPFAFADYYDPEIPVIELSKGDYYRSSQLVKWQLETAIQKYGIRTLINLRGENPDKKWWQDESAVAQQNGVKHINISMSAKRIPSRENLLKLLEAFRTAPRPLLVHCQAGVDRTGEASALYAWLYLGRSRAQARDQIFPSIMKAKWYFFDEVFQSEKWAYEAYDPCRQDYAYFDRFNCAP